VVSTTPRPLYPCERPGTHCTGGWVGPRAGLDVCEKSRRPPGFFFALFRSCRVLCYSGIILVLDEGLKENCITLVSLYWYCACWLEQNVCELVMGSCRLEALTVEDSGLLWCCAVPTGKVGTDVSGNRGAFIFRNIAMLTSILVPTVVSYLAWLSMDHTVNKSWWLESPLKLLGRVCFRPYCYRNVDENSNVMFFFKQGSKRTKFQYKTHNSLGYKTFFWNVFLYAEYLIKCKGNFSAVRSTACWYCNQVLKQKFVSAPNVYHGQRQRRTAKRAIRNGKHSLEIRNYTLNYWSVG
jgi:hypothetical protein